MSAELRQTLMTSGFSLVALGCALALALGLQRYSSSDGRARAAAAQILDKVESDDLILVAHSLGRGAADRGRILFAFRPFAAICDDAQQVDLHGLPFARVWVMAGVDPGPWGLQDKDLHLVSGASGWRLAQLEWAGAGQDGSAQVVKNLIDLWDPAGVFIKSASGVLRHRCAQPSAEGGVSCGAEPWFRVGPSIQSLAGTARSCLWAHPPRDADVLNIYLKKQIVKKSDPMHLALQVNFADGVRADPKAPPVFVRLSQAGRISEVRCSKNQGSCAVNFDWQPQSDPPLLRLWTEDNGRQLVCLTGVLLDGPVTDSVDRDRQGQP